MLPSYSKDNISASLPGPSSYPYTSFLGGISPTWTSQPSSADGFQIQSASLSFSPDSGIEFPFLFQYYRLLFTKAVCVNSINFGKYKQAQERENKLLTIQHPRTIHESLFITHKHEWVLIFRMQLHYSSPTCSSQPTAYRDYIPVLLNTLPQNLKGCVACTVSMFM